MVEIIETTLPLSPQNQIKFFKDRDNVKFVIDVENSKLTDKQCLMMVSNMKLKVDFKKITQDLMKEYLQAPFVVESDNLARACANVLTGAVSGNVFYRDVDDAFNLDDIAEFIASNIPLIENNAKVINSIPLFLLINSDNFISEEKKTSLKKEIKYVDDKVKGVGANISQIISIPDFLDNFLKPWDVVNLNQKPYYRYYFDEYVFGGDKLIRYILSKEHQSDFAIRALNVMEYVKKGDKPFTIKQDD